MKFVPQAPDSEGAKFMTLLGVTPSMEHIPWRTGIRYRHSVPCATHFDSRLCADGRLHGRCTCHKPHARIQQHGRAANLHLLPAHDRFGVLPQPGTVEPAEGQKTA